MPQQQKEPSSIFYHLGRRAGYWFAANRSRLIQNMIGGLVRRLPGGTLLMRWLR